MKDKRMITVIVGPTGTGKSQLGMHLAKELDGIIISADSRQVYIGADFGTNKIPLPLKDIHSLEKQHQKWVVNSIPIFGYDMVLPDEQFSVADFVTFASAVIDKWSNKKNIFIVGGTGFYIDTLLGRMPYSMIKPDVALREELRMKTADELFTLLASLDEPFTQTVNASDQKNAQRLIRYIELAKHAGSVQAARTYSPLRNIIDYRIIGLDASEEYMNEHVRRWVDSISDGSLQDEVRLLIQQGYRDTPLLHGIIYNPAVSFVQGSISEREMKETIIVQVWHYIKRQKTWFKRNKSIEWFDISQPGFMENVTRHLH